MPRQDHQNNLELERAVQENDIQGMKRIFDQVKKGDGEIDINRIVRDQYDLYQWKTLLYIAAENGNQEAVELLLTNGACPDVRTHESPLHAATKYGHAGIVKLLLEHNARVNNSTDQFGHTIFEAAIDPVGAHWTSETSRVAVVELLLKDNIDEILKNKGFMIAAREGFLYIIRLLLANGAITSQTKQAGFIEAAENGCLEIVKSLINEEAITLELKQRALLETSYRGRITVCKVLIESGVDVNYQDKQGLSDPETEYYGLTALHCAVLFDFGSPSVFYEEKYKIIQLLLSKGARILQSERDETPLHMLVKNARRHLWAENARFYDFIKLLLRAGAGPEEKDSEGNTLYSLLEENLNRYPGQPFPITEDKITELKTFHRAFIDEFKEKSPWLKNTSDAVVSDYVKIRGPDAFDVKQWLFNAPSSKITNGIRISEYKLLHPLPGTAGNSFVPQEIDTQISDEVSVIMLAHFGIPSCRAYDLCRALHGKLGQRIAHGGTILSSTSSKPITPQDEITRALIHQLPQVPRRRP
jgi:ankyrin repeat protein